MVTYLVIAAVCIFLALLANLPIVLRERRLLKLAESKLEITKTVNDINRLMLSGEIRLGEACHDSVYPIMVRAQYDGSFAVQWKLWQPPSEDRKKLREAIHNQIATGSPLGKILQRFVKAQFSRFQQQQPVAFFAFSIWVLFVAGGLVFFLMALISAITAKLAWRTFRKKFSLEYFNQLVGEWSLILSGYPETAINKNPDAVRC